MVVVITAVTDLHTWFTLTLLLAHCFCFACLFVWLFPISFVFSLFDFILFNECFFLHFFPILFREKQKNALFFQKNFSTREFFFMPPPPQKKNLKNRPKNVRFFSKGIYCCFWPKKQKVKKSIKKHEKMLFFCATELIIDCCN